MIKPTRHPHIYLIIALLPFIAGLAACSSHQIQPLALDNSAEINSRPEAEQTLRAFPAETLFDLLVAEIAGDRQEFGLTLSKYSTQAHATRDPQVVERATRIAVMLNANNYILDLASLWVDIAPDNIEAHRIAAYFLTKAGQLNKAFPSTIVMLQHGENDLLRNLTLSAATISPEQRQQLLSQYQQLPAALAQHEDILISKAYITWQQGDSAAALDTAQQINQRNPGNENAILLISQLMAQQGNTAGALDVIAQALASSLPAEQFDKKRLHLEYARLWAIRNDLNRAQQELSKMVVRYPDDDNLVFSLALISAELGLDEDAELLFRRLLNSSSKGLDANYQLARLLDTQGNTNEAILYYRQVRSGELMIPAALRLTHLMALQGQLLTAQRYLQQLRSEQPQATDTLLQVEAELLSTAGNLAGAYDLLTESLQINTNNINLLYARSLVSERRQQFDQMEVDLRAILVIDNRNSTAMNALGYALSNHTNRYTEAYDLIAAALQLQPDDAATLDSMGWVLYRMGRIQEAISYLQRALSMLPDPEIAAHLGEVLWANDQKQEALKIWQDSLTENPEAPIITRTMLRLQARPQP